MSSYMWRRLVNQAWSVVILVLCNNFSSAAATAQWSRWCPRFQTCQGLWELLKVSGTSSHQNCAVFHSSQTVDCTSVRFVKKKTVGGRRLASTEGATIEAPQGFLELNPRSSNRRGTRGSKKLLGKFNPQPPSKSDPGLHTSKSQLAVV